MLIDGLAAYPTVHRNLSVPAASPEPATIGEISASAFRVARVTPTSAARSSMPIFLRAIVLIGSGIVAGNVVLLLFVRLQHNLTLADVWVALLLTSAVMLGVGLLACVEPARRALRIDPSDALRMT